MTAPAPSDAAGQVLDGREVVLGVTGGIACYKAADLASKLVQAGAGVSVILTEAAERFVQPMSFQALTRRAVHTSLWQATENYRSGHLGLTDRAELLVVAPATANCLAKLAAGLADDLLSTTVLSAWRRCGVLLAPAMNTDMWLATPTQANVDRLKQFGAHVVGPAEGNLACGTTGPGRMAEPAEILQRVVELLEQKS